ncbi:hypothetical protein HI914_05165 [Erysiphe necator]|nr:hypothetical protein HI914_05165 [Erysiphe necator]
MLNPDSTSQKARRSTLESIPRLINPRLLCVPETFSQPSLDAKKPDHSFVKHSKEHHKDAHSQNYKVLSKNVPERSSKYDAGSVHAGPRRNFSQLANHNSVNYGMKNKAVRAGEFYAEKEWISNCVSELYSAVIDLHTASITINRRLDDTYYSILEKLTSIQSTIVSLKELAAITRQLNVRLLSECHKVAHESNKQLDSFESFQNQATRIKELKSRVDIGRQNFLGLIDRVRHVQKRVESLEMNERKWRNTTRKRLRIFWSSLIGILTLTLLFYLLSWWVTEHADGKPDLYLTAMQIDSPKAKDINLKDLNKPILNLKAEVLDETNNRCSRMSDKYQSPRVLNEL